MKKIFNLWISTFIVFAMVMSLLTVPASAADNPAETKSTYADFEGMTSAGQTATVYDAKDTRGTEILPSALTVTSDSGDPIIKSFSLVSPLDGAIIEKDKELVIKATSANIEGADVEFTVNGQAVSNVTANSDGTFTAKWTPITTGTYTVAATAEHQGDTFTADAENIRVLGTSAYTSNWRNVITNSNTATHGDGTPVANGYTSNSITFKRTKDSAPYTQIYNSSVSSGYTAGYIVAEAEVTAETGGSFNIANRNAGSDNKSQTAISLSGGKIYYRNGTTSVESNITYTQGVKHHVKTVWDLENKKIYLYLDGEQLPIVTTMRTDWQNIYQMRFNVATTKSDDGPSVTLQNEKLIYYPPSPKVISTAAKDALGNTLSSDQMTAANVKSFEISYNMALKADTVNTANVKLYRGSGTNAPVEANVELTNDTKIKVTPKNDAMIVSSGEYRVEISENLTSAGGQGQVQKHYTASVLFRVNGVCQTECLSLTLLS